MERITEKFLTRTARDVSAMFNDDIRVEVTYHSGSAHLELCQGDRTIRSLRAGTKREMYEYLNAMRETLYIIGRD